MSIHVGLIILAIICELIAAGWGLYSDKVRFNWVAVALGLAFFFLTFLPMFA